MAESDHHARLLAIIEAQNEIVASQLDLDSVLNLVAARARSLTHADAAVVELADGEEMVCRAAAGMAEPHVGSRQRRDSSLSGICMEHNRVLRTDYTTSADSRIDPEPW